MALEGEVTNLGAETIDTACVQVLCHRPTDRAGFYVGDATFAVEYCAGPLVHGGSRGVYITAIPHDGGEAGTPDPNLVQVSAMYREPGGQPDRAVPAQVEIEIRPR